MREVAPGTDAACTDVRVGGSRKISGSEVVESGGVSQFCLEEGFRFGTTLKKRFYRTGNMAGIVFSLHEALWRDLKSTLERVHNTYTLIEGENLYGEYG